MFRAFVMLLSVLVVLATSGCGVWRGDKTVENTDPSDNGPGLVTGRDGGIVIFQK